MTRRSEYERFENFIMPIPESGCWVWMGKIMHRGYGEFWAGGKSIRAHRYSWIIHNGSIPEGKFVLHKCDVRSCVNPDHLFLGTQSENIRDMDEKGRRPNREGELCPTHKLTEQDVLQIRKLRASGEKQRVIAEKFGVKQPCISNVLTGQRWAHVRDDS